MQCCGMGDGNAQLVAENVPCCAMQGKAWIMLENGNEKALLYNLTEEI